MSDVILYAALKENEKLASELSAIRANRASSLKQYSENAILPGGDVLELSQSGSCIPTMVADWETYLKPFVEVRNNGFKVCDTSGNFRCGSTCAWTVPAGVTNVQFQLWGAGGGTSSQCCCGGAPFGPTGAYAVIKMNVSAGEAYTLCAGCARCCYATQTTPGLCGNPSWVTGPGLCICADGGVSCMNFWAQDIKAVGSGDNSTQGLPHFSLCAANSCAGWNFCWDTLNDDTDICHAFSRQTWHMTCTDPTRNVEVYGINGMWPSMFISQEGLTNTYSVSAPVFGFENATCCKVWTPLSEPGVCFQANQGVQQGPSFGGFATVSQSNTNACCGDAGGMGMICVSWNVG